MRHSVFTTAIVLGALGSASHARAGIVGFDFSGAGVGGSGLLTFGPDATAGDPAGALAITGATGTFSDATLGLYNIGITGIVAAKPAMPEPTNTFAPKSFGWYNIGPGIISMGKLVPGFAYDDLFYPAGSPRSAADYPFHGGFLDIYGATFTLANGDAVNVWSDGDMGHGVTYGVGVTDGVTKLDDVFAGLAASVPEPGSVAIVVAGLAGLLAWRRRPARSGATVSQYS